MPTRPPIFSARTASERREMLRHSRAEYDSLRAANPALARAARIRNSANWQKCRKMMLAAAPVCRDPYGWHKGAGVVVPAAQVHHIAGLATNPELAFDEANLAPVCLSCHAALEQDAKAGVPTAQLFNGGR